MRTYKFLRVSKINYLLFKGFYEGGKLNPNPLTWLDRLLIGLVGGLIYYNDERKGMKESSSYSM